MHTDTSYAATSYISSKNASFVPRNYYNNDLKSFQFTGIKITDIEKNII